MKHILPIYEFDKPLPDEKGFGPETLLNLRKTNYFDERLDLFESTYSDKDWEDIISVLERDCGQFLSEIMKSKYPVFRGVTDDPGTGKPYGMLEKTPRKDRITKDMRKDVTDQLDEGFQKKFGHKLRSEGVFTTKEFDTAQKYGRRRGPWRDTCLFFPKDGYEYYWHPEIKDLYVQIRHTVWYEGTKLKHDEVEKEWHSVYGEPDLTIGSFYDITTGGGVGKYTNSRKDRWIPEVGFDDYIKKRHRDFKKLREKKINEIVNGYKGGGLSSIGQQEIIYICDSYYVIDDAFLPKLLYYIE